MKPENNLNDEENNLLEMAKEIVDKHLYLAMRILARKPDESAESVIEKVRQERVETCKEYL